MNDAQVKYLETGDVLFLERRLTASHWPSGYFALHLLTTGVAVLSLVRQDEGGLSATGETFTVSIEDLTAFSRTTQKARLGGR